MGVVGSPSKVNSDVNGEDTEHLGTKDFGCQTVGGAFGDMVVIGDAGEACQDLDARYTFGEMEQITRFDDSLARVRALAIEKMLMISPHVNGYVDDGI